MYFGTLKEGASIRVEMYNHIPIVYYDGGMVNSICWYAPLNIINTPSLHDEYLYDREIIKNKVWFMKYNLESFIENIQKRNKKQKLIMFIL